MKKKVRSMFGLCLLMLGTANVSAQAPLSTEEPKPTCTVFNSWDGKNGETCTMMGVSSNGNYAIGWIESSLTGVFWEREGNKVTQIFSPYEEEGVDNFGNPIGMEPAGSFTFDVSNDGTIVGAFKDIKNVDKYGRICFAPGYRTIDGTWKRVPLLAENLSGRDQSGKVVKISKDGTVMGGHIKAVDSKGNETGNVPAIWKNGKLEPTVPVADARYFELTAMSEDGTKWAGIKIDKMLTAVSSYTSVLYDGKELIEMEGTKPDNSYTGGVTRVSCISENGKYACGHYYTSKLDKNNKLITYVKGYLLDIATKTYTWIDDFVPTVVMNDGTMFGRDRDDTNLVQTKAAVALAYVNGELKDFSAYMKETYETTAAFDALKISNITGVTEWENGRCTMVGYVEEGGNEPARRPFVLTLEEPKAPVEPKTVYAFNAGTYSVGPSYVSFDLTNPVLNKINDVQKGISIAAGAEANGIYYATDFLGSADVESPNLYTVDIKTGLASKVCGISEMIFSMAYDRSSNTMYAAVFNASGGGGEIKTLDLTKGTTTPAFALKDGSIVGIACDKEGKLYALDGEGNFYSVDKTAKTFNKINATGLVPEDFVGQALVFDPETDNLYWACTGKKDVRWAQIDVTTGKATVLHTFDNKTETLLGLSALYIPGPTEIKVANLKAMKDAGANDELPYQITGEVLVTSVLPSMMGTTVYMEDETAAIIVNIGEMDIFDYQVGDKLKNVKGHYTYLNSFSFEFISAEKVSDGNPVTPIKITVPELNKNFGANEARYVEIENAVLVFDEDEYTYYLVQENDSASIMPTAMEHMELMGSLVNKTVSFTGMVTFVDDNNNVALNTISLVEYVEPVPAYAYKIGETMGFVSFDLNKPAELTLLKEDADGIISAGAGVNDKYYAASIQEGWGAAVKNGTFYSVNTTTGEFTSLGANLTATIRDMAFDYTTATMFGVSISERGEARLHKVDLKNGKLTSVGELQDPILALACDKEGQLYGIGSDGDFYKVNKADATLTKVDATGVTPTNANQSMAFDHNSGKLYWMCAAGEEYTTLNTIDVATGVATQVYSYEKADLLLTALYIPCDVEIQYPDQTFTDLKTMKAAGAGEAKYIVSGEVLVTGVRTSGDATIFYVEDATAAIAVNYTGETECPYKSGDKLKDLKGKLVVNGTVNSFDFESATLVSSNNEVVPTLLTIAQVNAGYPANEAKYISIEKADVAMSPLDRVPALSQGDDKVLTMAEKAIVDLQGKVANVTAHIESANREGIVILSIDSAVEYDFISAAQVKDFYYNNSEVVAEGAARIEIYDVAGRMVIASDTEAVSVSGMNGVIVAKAIYANGEVKLSKFVVK